MILFLQMASELHPVPRDKTVKWEEALKQVQEITVNFLQNIDETDIGLEARAKDLHKQVDDILSQSRQDLQKIKSSGLANLQGQEKYLADGLQQLRDTKESREENSDEAIPVTPETVQISLFIKGEDDVKSMKEIFGHILAQSASQKGTDKKGEDSSTPETIESKSSLSTRSLVQTPPILSTFNVMTYSPQIICAGQGLAWLKIDHNNVHLLKLVDKNGSSKQTIRTDFSISEVALTSNGEILLLNSQNRSIKSVSQQGQITTLFRTSSYPSSLCCLHNGDIVVAFSSDNKVTVYNGVGHIKQTLDNIRFQRPMKLAVNKVNQDIYVKCHSHNGNLVTAVTVYGQLRYEYVGQDEDTQFQPEAVCTDMMGHILIADSGIQAIHILDQDGQLIRYIDNLILRQGFSFPETIDVDREGCVWVGNTRGEDRFFVGMGQKKKGCIMVARYLQ